VHPALSPLWGAGGNPRPSVRQGRNLVEHTVGGEHGRPGAGQTGGMQNSQPSGAKGFAVLVGVMVVIVLAIMAVAVLLSPH
jgi:hypothetical protein